MTFVMMFVTFMGWYRARIAQGLDTASLYYIAPFTPWSAYSGLVIGTCALIFVGFDQFAPFSVQGFITSYFCLPYSAGLFIFWKFYKKTSFVDPTVADLVTGKAEIDEECKHWEEGGIEENYKKYLDGLPFWKRCWERIW